jgi:hypothetical protein
MVSACCSELNIERLQPIQRCVTEFMASACCSESNIERLQCLDVIYGGNGKSSELPMGMPLVTCGFASSEHVWDPMASSSAKFCLKTRTVQRWGFDHAIPYLGLQCVDAIECANG